MSEKRRKSNDFRLFGGRSEESRTPGLMDPNVRGRLQTTISSTFGYFCVGLQILFEALKSMCYIGLFRVLGQNLGQILKGECKGVRKSCAAINKEKTLT
jgi:hypothetical protein